MKCFKFSNSARFIILLVLAFVVSPTKLQAQTAEPTNSGEGVQARIERAKALIAAHQLETAAGELESVRGANPEPVVRNITSIMLMNIYLEAGNYGRAEALLEESFKSRSKQSGDSVRTYFALAGQAINGSRSHIARYRSLGINITEPNLPAEAVTDLDRLRSFLERMIAQAKEIASEKKAYDSLALMEDVLGLRLSLARDSEDQTKWQTEYASARESLASQKHIASLGGISALPPAKVALNNSSSPSPYSTRRTNDSKELEKNNSTSDPAAKGSAPTETSTQPQDQSNLEKPDDAGLLNNKATKRVIPAYPPLAKQVGQTGLVRVHVIVDEQGKVVEVSRIEGPMLLRRVAEDAARQWFFEVPSERAGRLSGYIDFNFTL